MRDINDLDSRSHQADGTVIADDEGGKDRSVSGEGPRTPTPAPARPGQSLGRYVVLEEVGRGGMGRVLRAYDPKLQREVALKELKVGTMQHNRSKRLVEEARAMAKLSHRNVVAVYDVEPLDDRLVLAMEYVPGTTLRAWLKDERPKWQEVISRFVEAGRGLAAAHAEGLLHRDFKPSNVLVALDVRVDECVVKVGDFGLAKPAVSSDSLGWASPAPERNKHTSSTQTQHTETSSNAVMGTPRYMAPEQHQGDSLTTAADQYAFCVALWEALTGHAPFRGPDILELKLEGPAAWPGNHSRCLGGRRSRRGSARGRPGRRARVAWALRGHNSPGSRGRTPTAARNPCRRRDPHAAGRIRGNAACRALHSRSR